MTNVPVNLFVVRTPLQLFNAIEARDRLHVGERNALLMQYGSAVDHELMEGLLDDGWQVVRRYAYNGLRRKLYAWLLASWLRQLGRPQVLYIGLITHLPLHVANFCAPQSLRLLDDGNETLLIARRLHELRQHLPRRRLWLERLLRQCLDPRALVDATAFSIYDTEPLGLPRLVNDYRMFRQRMKSLPTRSCVVFIGSNLVGNYFKGEEEFLQALAAVHERWPGKLMYCPHRYESQALRERIQALGFELFLPDTILENAFMYAGWSPESLATFRSTAIDTLARIYGLPGVMVEMPLTSIIAAKLDELDMVWQTFRTGGGRVLMLSDMEPWLLDP
jgi:hypothetical protein